MYILVDYENVLTSGLEGVKFLTRDDTLIIFYSGACQTIRNDELRKIRKSKCKWEIKKLLRTGKNGLDFYIASRVGAILTADSNAYIGIVSKDNGFNAVLDYWSTELGDASHIVKGPTVSACLTCSQEPAHRKAYVHEAIKAMPLEEVYQNYLEFENMKTMLKEIFGEGDYYEMSNEIIMILDKDYTPKVLYTTFLKNYGREKGLEIYRAVKERL